MHQRDTVRRLAITCLALLMAACSESSREDLANRFKDSYDASFRQSFRDSFVATCSERDASASHVALCNCMADDLLETFTPDELQDIDTMRSHVQSQGLPKCRAQALEGEENQQSAE